MAVLSTRYLSIWEMITRLVDLIGLFLAMCLSELLVENIILGGAIYITGEVWVVYARLYNKRSISLLPSGIRNKGFLVFAVAGLLTVALVWLYPYIQSKITGLAMTVLIAGFIVQQIVTDIAAKRMVLMGRRRTVTLVLLHTAFLAAYAVFFWLNRRLLAYTVSPEIYTVYMLTVIAGMVLLGCQLSDTTPPAQPPQSVPAPSQSAPPKSGDAADGAPKDTPIGDTLMDVHSYRIYNRMTVSVFFAINMSITAFICYMRFLPYTGMLTSVLLLCAWLAIIALITGLCLSLLRKRYLVRYDRPAIFGAGLLFWVLATVNAFRGTWDNNLWGSLANAACMGASIACMLSIILQQSYEMKTVIELGVGHIDEGSYARNTSAMLDWSALLSYLLLLIMLTIASFIMDGRLDELEAHEGMRSLLRIAMLVLPMFAVLAGLVFSLLQPLDRHYAQKLKKYSGQMAQGKQNAPLEARLKKMLVANYPRRIALILIKPLVRPFFPCRVYGKEHVDVSGGPVVFVCNHLEIYGPIIAVLHSPFPFRPWVIQEMLDKDAVVAHMRTGVSITFGFIPQRMREALTRWAAPVVLWVLNATDPIPVYRGAVRGVIQTITESVDAMTYDDNILIFPEITYPERGVGDFFTGFVQVAKSYHRQTGKCATFCPMYVDKKNKRLTYDESITYDPSNGAGAEKDRIVDFLKDSIQRMADAAPQ